MLANAPYYGGSSPGANLFAVDGDFTQCDPCGPPIISYPFSGDSMPDVGSQIMILNPTTKVFDHIALGTYPNVGTFQANQTSIIIDQEFMVAQAYYQPMRLNTPYNPAWSLGWTAVYRNLSDCFLVSEGTLEDVGGGISKIRRRFASLPRTRNEVESYAMTFPAYSIDSATTREAFTEIVPSRILIDYFVYDDLNLLSIPLFNNNTGRRLNGDTGLFPSGLIIPSQKYYEVQSISSINPVDRNGYISNGAPLIDNTDATLATNPQASEYAGWIDAGYEICAESSTFTNWMGNIYQRKTRFVKAQ